MNARAHEVVCADCGSTIKIIGKGGQVIGQDACLICRDHRPAGGGSVRPRTVEPMRRIRRALEASQVHQDARDIIEVAIQQIEMENWHYGRERGIREGQEAMRQRVLDMVGAQLAPAEPAPPPIPRTIYLSPAQVAAGLAEVERVQEDLDQDGGFTL